jgi:hypothetical protein
MNDLIQKRNWIDNKYKRSAKFADKLKYIFAKVLNILNNMFKVASFVNLVLFFVTHKMRTIPERLLGITMSKIDPTQERFLEFTYINRLIVWNAIGQSLQAVLPFIDITSIKSIFSMTSKLTERI